MLRFISQKSRYILRGFIKLLATVVVAVSTLGLHANAATVEIEWVAPDKYKDIDNDTADSELSAFQSKVFTALESKLNELAFQLPEEQILKVKMFDIDLAGQVVDKSTERLREITESQHPKLKFTYKLFQQIINAENDGSVVELIKAGGVNLKATDFLQHSDTLENSFLHYEKQMLEKWFVFTFLPREQK